MPKQVEDCVKKISGTNKKTGKPYTESEKWAICQAANKKSKNSELSLEDIGDIVANTTYNYAQKLLNSGKASSLTQAYELAQVSLQKHNYNYEVLEMIIGS